MKSLWIIPAAVVVLSVATAPAVEHSLQPLDEPAPADAVSADIGPLLQPKGMRIIRGTSRTLCDIWFCKEWTVAQDAKPKGDVIYPFQPGQLIGVVRFARKSSDFRDQDIVEGVYTLRYGQQPVDGAHVGTSPTRDFLLLLKADEDKSVTALEYKQLTKASAAAAGSSHPLLWSLQRVEGTPAKEPTLRYNEDKEWWIIAVSGRINQGGQAKPQPLELVVVGKAGE